LLNGNTNPGDRRIPAVRERESGRSLSFQADYARRASFEGTISQAASRGARRARYRGLP